MERSSNSDNRQGEDMAEDGYCQICLSVHTGGSTQLQCLRCYHFICSETMDKDHYPFHKVIVNDELCGPVARVDQLLGLDLPTG